MKTGTVTEHFDNVMEPLTSTLHAALLLGCALSRYLGGWDYLLMFRPIFALLSRVRLLSRAPASNILHRPFSASFVSFPRFRPASQPFAPHTLTRQTPGNLRVTSSSPLCFFDGPPLGSSLLPFAAAHRCIQPWASCGRMFGCSHSGS